MRRLDSGLGIDRKGSTGVPPCLTKGMMIAGYRCAVRSVDRSRFDAPVRYLVSGRGYAGLESSLNRGKEVGDSNPVTADTAGPPITYSLL
jgi:hypothetical protein